MNIIIFYQHITREYKSCENLKKELQIKFKNSNVKILSIDFEYTKALRFNKKEKIDIIFMPWLAVRENYFYMMPFLKNNPKLMVINLHHEQIGSQVSFDVLMPKDKILHNNIYHFCWGEFFANKLIELGVDKNNVFITGNIRSDLAKKELINKEDLVKEFNLDSSKKIILFAESRDWVWSFGDKDIAEMQLNGCDKDEVTKSIDIHKQFLLKTYDDFNNLPDKFFEKYEIVYRPHPGTITPININERIKVCSKYSIYDWINLCDVFMCSTSTSIFEAELMKKPCIICEKEEFPSKYQMFGLEKYYHINSILNLNENDIKKAKSNIKNTIYNKYIGNCDGKCTKRIAETTEKIYNKNSVNMEFFEAPNKFFVRKKLFELITKMVVKLKMLNFLKFPRSAFREKNDIPYMKKNKI